MEGSAATAALEGRYAALRASAADLSSDELLDVIELAQREKDAASARQAVALAHLSAREPALLEDGTWTEVHHGLGYQRLDAPELAAPRMGVSVHVASNRILDAIRQMTRTPAVVDAMASGDLDEYRASIVSEETEFLSAESAAEVVDRIKEVWGQLTAGPLRRLLARTAAQVDPNAVTAHAEDERARRGLTRRTGVHGTEHWRGDFKVEQARGAWAAVTERARQLVREGQADSLELGRADAMMELILEHSDVKVIVHTTRAATDPTTATTSGDTTSTAASPDPALGSSTGALEDLVEVGGLGAPGTTFVARDWIDGCGTADPDRDLTCDTDTGALLTGDVPAAFASGRTRRSRTATAADTTSKYRIPEAMARLVRLRDGSCRFPNCATPARQCDLDHVRAWPAGPTATTNLMALCRRHHRIKQRHGWTAKLHPDSTVTWTDPTERQQTTWPVDHLHLITAGATRRDPTAPGSHRQPVEIPTTFEEELAELLDSHDIPRHPRTHPIGFDIDGNTFGGPPPRIDLDRTLETGAGPWDQILIDYPPRPPQPPQAIPF